MKAEKDKNTGKWLIQFRYTNWQGERKKTTNLDCRIVKITIQEM